jgi:hypothetical protein
LAFERAFPLVAKLMHSQRSSHFLGGPGDMSNYATIKQLIKDDKAMTGKYEGLVRHIWPMVIGKSDKPGPGSGKEPIVLGYQFHIVPAPPIPTPSVLGWRCYKIDKFDGTVAELPSPTTPRPNELTAKELKRQNAVQEPDTTP